MTRPVPPNAPCLAAVLPEDGPQDLHDRLDIAHLLAAVPAAAQLTLRVARSGHRERPGGWAAVEDERAIVVGLGA